MRGCAPAGILDELLERQILMAVRADRHLADAREQLAERGISGQVAAEHQRVDEETDERLDVRAITIGNRRTNDDVILSAIAMQQSLERREQRHEQRCRRVARERAQGRREFGRQLERSRRAAEALYGGPRAIGGQLEQARTARQLSFPIRELLVQHCAGQPLALPCREVGVLDRERRQLGRLPVENAR